RFVLGQVLVRLAGGTHPAAPDMPLAIAPEVPRHQRKSAADRTGAPRGAGREGVREIGAGLHRDVGHGAHMLGSCPRLGKADLLYCARRVRVRQLRIGLAQLNVTVGDVEGNARRVLDEIERARALGVDLVAFPELCLTGYPPEDLLFRSSFIEANLRALD